MNVDWAVVTPWIVAASIVTFVASLVVLPLLLISMPADYFVHRGPRFGWLSSRHPMIWFSILAVKNLFGFSLFIIGIVMLAMPGQGILAVLIGVCLMDFPGKRRLERAILRRKGILATLNAIRVRAGKSPLQQPDGVEGETGSTDQEHRDPSLRKRA